MARLCAIRIGFGFSLMLYYLFTITCESTRIWSPAPTSAKRAAAKILQMHLNRLNKPAIKTIQVRLNFSNVALIPEQKLELRGSPLSQIRIHLNTLRELSLLHVFHYPCILSFFFLSHRPLRYSLNHCLYYISPLFRMMFYIFSKQ